MSSDDIVKNIVGKIMKVNSSQIKMGKNKKDKKLELTGKHLAREITFKEIKKSREYKKRDNIEEWIPTDFVLLAYNKYYELTGKKLQQNILPNAMEINKIFEYLYNIFGFQPNLMMRDYITFFFEKHAKSIIRKEGEFYFNHLRRKHIIEDFYNNYNYNKSLHREKLNESEKNNIRLIEKDIESTYSLNEDNVVYEYGIIIAINWFSIKCNHSNKQAISMVYDICKKMVKKNIFETVKKKTELYSPYPKYLNHIDINKFLKLIDCKILIDIDFISDKSIDDKFLFLKSK